MQLIILGMQRSGSALLAELLHLMGVFLPAEAQPSPAETSDKRQGEDRYTILSQHGQEILQSSGYEWDRVAHFSTTALQTSARESYTQLSSSLIRTFNAHRPWVIRDPLLCLLFPLWKPLLTTPICIHIHRDPLEITLSLKKHNTIGLHAGIALWETYTLSAFASTTGLPRILVSHSNLIEQPLATARYLLDSLIKLNVTGIHLPSDHDISQLLTSVKTFKQPSLTIEDIINRKQAELLASIEDGSILTGGSLFSLSTGAQAILEEHEATPQRAKPVDKKKAEHVTDRERYRNRLQQAEKLLSKQLAATALFEQKSKELANRLNRAQGELRNATIELAQLKKRKVVRAGLKLAKAVWHGNRLIRQPKRAFNRRQPAKPTLFTRIRSHMVQRKMLHHIKNLRPDDRIHDGPLVSIIIVTRNGYHHMQRLFEALEHTTSYRNFEVIVVDNDSRDNTRQLLEKKRSFPVHVIGNRRNASFSEANNQAAEKARGSLLLFLNNDIEPIHKSWLGAMVEPLLADERRAAAGALLIYPHAATPSHLRKKNRHGFTVQHLGIKFYWRRNAPHPLNITGDKQVDDPALKSLLSMPAVTAACMLIRTNRFHEVNGFDEHYIYGGEDVDLCLKLRQNNGEIVCVGEAALFHHESATQNKLTAATKRINRAGNWQYFIERWGSKLHRTLLLDNFPPNRHETTTSADDLQKKHFWSASHSPKLAITVSNNDPLAGYGDWYTAHELGDAFAKAGWEVIFLERHQNRWENPPQDLDLIIALLDAYNPQTAPAHTHTVAWIRNWTDRWIAQPYFDKYDQIIVSSSISADIVEKETGWRPDVICLGSNTEKFSPRPPEPTYECDYAFTGNNWGHSRTILKDLTVLKEEKFLLFGKGWENVPEAARYWRGSLPYDALPDLYASAKIILDDTAGHTLPYGAINSRVFDALACGTLVISNNSYGSREFFNGLLPTYDSTRQLRELLNTYLDNDTLRNQLASRLREMVVANHTYPHICDDFQQAIRKTIERSKIAIKIAVPRPEGAQRWGDTHFASCFSRALQAAGFRTAIHLRSDWDLPKNQDADIVIHLRGLYPYVPKPGAFNILWVISHPADITTEECESYDLIFVASHSFAEHLSTKVEVPVHILLQATDEHRFRPVTIDEKVEAELLFVGNTRKQTRECVQWASELDNELHIYGTGWEEQNIPQEFIKNEYFPNERLNELYSSAQIIINDHWPDMRKHGFIANRIFDALACKGFIISDDVPALQKVFQGAVPTFSNQEEFSRIVHNFLKHPEKRDELARIGQGIVLQNHTFGRRALQVKHLIATQLKTTDEEVTRAATFEKWQGKKQYM